MTIGTSFTPGTGQARLTALAPEEAAGCTTCGTAPDEGYVYAIGRIEARFPTLAIEKEFVQAAARLDTQGMTDHQVHQAVLAQRENRYLLRRLCWVFSIQGLETYLLRIQDDGDYDLLTGALRDSPDPSDIDVVVGRRVGLAPPSMCNGLIVPVVVADQIYSFDRKTLIEGIPRPERTTEAQFRASSREVLDEMIMFSDNLGASDEHRALNYLALRYPALYHRVAENHARDTRLSAVAVRPSGLGQTRRIMDVVLSFTNRKTDVVEKYLVRVDVTEQFPFLATKLSPYFDV